MDPRPATAGDSTALSLPQSVDIPAKPVAGAHSASHFCCLHFLTDIKRDTRTGTGSLLILVVGIVGQIRRANSSRVGVSRRGVTWSDSLRPQADVRHVGYRALEGEAAGGRLLRPGGDGGMDQGGSSGDKKGGDI